jgi:hypothetical protein
MRMVKNQPMSSVVTRALGAILIAIVAIASTGGPDAVGFWSTAAPAYLSVIMASVGLGVAMIPVLPMIPIGRMLRRRLPGWGRHIDLGLRGLVALIPGTLYFLSEESIPTMGARLPSEDPGLGTVMVMGMAAVAYTAVHLATRRLVPPETRPPRAPTSGPAPWVITTPEPGEEFWSPDEIEGWRVWAWTGKILKGSFERDWPSSEMEADCVVCVDPPGWDCPCGIYAMKDRRAVPPSRPGSVIVGKVAMSGRVIEHEDGYRASHARITAVWIDDVETARRVALAYPEVRVWSGGFDQKMPSRSPKPRADRIP